MLENEDKYSLKIISNFYLKIIRENSLYGKF